MSPGHRADLSREETDAFLGRHETGVLSLASGDEPYSIPVSYGYDSVDRRFFLRLVSSPDSEKRRFLDASAHARLVVYERDGDVYRSVVGTGTIEEVPREELTVEHVEQYGDAKRPLFEMWGASKRDLDVRLYRFTPEVLTGRQVEVDREG